jgi:hypothetical protein
MGLSPVLFPPGVYGPSSALAGLVPSSIDALVTQVKATHFNTTPSHEFANHLVLIHHYTMAAPAVSFDSFVKQNREKKKNEALAQQFLGGGANRGRKGNGAGNARGRVESEKPSLLSRVNGGAGVQKRSASAKPASSIEGKWQHDLHKLNNPRGGPRGGGARNPPRTAPTSQLERNSRTYEKFAPVLNARGAGARSNDAPGFSIRGVATGGPCTVIASNFAPGTTAADIEAVMIPVGGETLGCRLISASPTVMVELQFASKEGAENVVATFNNQKVGHAMMLCMSRTGLTIWTG